MTRQEAIWYLTPIAESASLERYKEALGLAISALREQEERRWIPVTERLPENDQWVLCFMKDKAFGAFRVFQWNYIDWQWNDGNEWYDENDVTHWMPLPEPPKEGA